MGDDRSLFVGRAAPLTSREDYIREPLIEIRGPFIDLLFDFFRAETVVTMKSEYPDFQLDNVNCRHVATRGMESIPRSSHLPFFSII